MALEGFESSIGGIWTSLRDENADDFLRAMGIGYIQRKLACALTTYLELQKTGDNQIRFITKGPNNSDRTLTLDEPTEAEDPFGNKVKATISWDTVNCVLTTTSEPLSPKAKQTTVTRRIINNELVMQIDLPNDNIVCTRYFKKDAS